MVSIEDSHSRTHSLSNSKINRSTGRSMRTLRSAIFATGGSNRSSPNVSQNLTDSLIDFKLDQLSTATRNNNMSPSSNALSSPEIDEILEASRTFTNFSSCSSDISGELQLLASLPDPNSKRDDGSAPMVDLEPEPCSGFLERENFSTEIIESISPEDLQPTVKLCVDSLRSPSLAMKRSAAAKLRLLAKNRADNRVLICDSGAVPSLIPLLRCPDPLTQEHAVTALLNLSLHDQTRGVIARASDSVKSLIYVLKTGTETSKQNAACALLSLSLLEDYKLSIGASGAIPPLVQLLINGTNRGKKDALTTLYKLCSVKLNKERAVNAGVVKALVGLVLGGEVGLAEKAMVVMSSLAAVENGREAIVEEGGVAALVEVVEDGQSEKGKEFAVVTLLEMCREERFGCRCLLVREGGIPPLVALSQNGTPKAKHKAETLLAYLRESRQEASSSSP